MITFICLECETKLNSDLLCPKCDYREIYTDRHLVTEYAKQQSLEVLEEEIIRSRFSRFHMGGPIEFSSMESEREKILQEVYWLKKLKESVESTLQIQNHVRS